MGTLEMHISPLSTEIRCVTDFILEVSNLNYSYNNQKLFLKLYIF